MENNNVNTASSTDFSEAVNNILWHQRTIRLLPQTDFSISDLGDRLYVFY